VLLSFVILAVGWVLSPGLMSLRAAHIYPSGVQIGIFFFVMKGKTKHQYAGRLMLVLVRHAHFWLIHLNVGECWLMTSRVLYRLTFI
jgi:hypothetical protein